MAFWLREVKIFQQETYFRGCVGIEFDLKNIGDEAVTANFEYKAEDNGTIPGINKKMSYETLNFLGAKSGF